MDRAIGCRLRPKGIRGRCGNDERYWTDGVHAAIEDYARFRHRHEESTYYLHPVGHELANGFSLHDVLGGDFTYPFRIGSATRSFGNVPRSPGAIRVVRTIERPVE